VLREASRALKPGGRFVLCDMLPHEREEYKSQMGHVWLGFAEDQLRRLLGAAGFNEIRIATLPVDPAAKGPALFVASGSKGSTGSKGS
jgi:ArsR family transcriptional regulator